jgi:hypothetical protein
MIAASALAQFEGREIWERREGWGMSGICDTVLREAHADPMARHMGAQQDASYFGTSADRLIAIIQSPSTVAEKGP